MEKIIELTDKANEYFSNGEYKEALKYYYSALTEDVENSICHCNIGITYEMLRETELAVAFYKKAIRLDDKNVRAINNLARIYIDEVKDFDIATKYLDYAIETAPNDAEAYNLYGNLSLIKKDYEIAKSYFKKSIFLDEYYFKNYFDLAKALIELNNIDEAKEMLDKSLELRADFIPAIELRKSLN